VGSLVALETAIGLDLCLVTAGVVTLDLVASRDCLDPAGVDLERTEKQKSKVSGY